jgi:hypothetical protein
MIFRSDQNQPAGSKSATDVCGTLTIEPVREIFDISFWRLIVGMIVEASTGRYYDTPAALPTDNAHVG